MRKIFQACSTLWFTLKLSVLLASFLAWFSFQRYLLGRVFLVSFCWLTLALLLVLNQLLVWHRPNVFQPQLVQDLAITADQETHLTWRLVTQSQLEEICGQITQVAARFPTHQSLQRNLALCQLTQEQTSAAQNSWQKAQQLQPNQ